MDRYVLGEKKIDDIRGICYIIVIINYGTVVRFLPAAFLYIATAQAATKYGSAIGTKQGFAEKTL